MDGRWSVVFLDLCLPARPIRPGDLRLFRNYLASDFPSSVGVQRLDSLVPARVPPLRAAATGGRSIFCSGAPTSIIAIPRSLSQSHTRLALPAPVRAHPGRRPALVASLPRGLGLVQSMTKPICAIGHRPIAFDRNPHAMLRVYLDHFAFCVFMF